MKINTREKKNKIKKITERPNVSNMHHNPENVAHINLIRLSNLPPNTTGNLNPKNFIPTAAKHAS